MSPLGRAVSLACALSLAGCNLGEGGTDPTPATLNFPIALALSPVEGTVAPRFLYVLNSNFDLRFNDGTLMAFDLDTIAGTDATNEGMIAGCTADEPCTFEDLSQVRLSEVGIGSHADGLAVSPGGSRVYVASRARRNLTFVDSMDGRLECEQEDTEEGEAVPSCSDIDPGDAIASEREIELDGDPVAVATGRLADIGGGDGNFVLLGLRDGNVALFIDEENAGLMAPPELVHIANAFPGFPANQVSVVTLTMQPGTGIAWLTNARSASLGRVGLAVDPRAPDRSFLYDAGRVRLGGVDTGEDSRDLQFDPSFPEERAFVLSRRPEAVLELDLTRTGLNAGDAAVGDLFDVGAGPSRLAVGTVGGRSYVLATTFDNRKIYVVDATAGAPVAVVGGFSGPFELVIDSARELAYVTDFSLSVIRIVDLSPLETGGAPFIRATLGRPTPIESFTD